MKELNHTIRKFNRFELKYVITLQQAAKLKSALRAYLVPDEHGNNTGRYALASLYYDSPDFRCYQEKTARPSGYAMTARFLITRRKKKRSLRRSVCFYGSITCARQVSSATPARRS